MNGEIVGVVPVGGAAARFIVGGVLSVGRLLFVRAITHKVNMVINEICKDKLSKGV